MTLYHWDLPQALQDRGGWGERDTAYRFADYAAIVHSRLSDRVGDWTTLNEPWCSAFLGYHAETTHRAHRRGAALRAMHHLLLGHGLAVQALRAQSRTVGLAQRLSIVLNLSVVRADGDTETHREAVRRVDGLQNRIYLDPVLRGVYPPDILTDLEPVTDFSFVRDGDLEVVAGPVDLLGVNYYSCIRVAPGPDAPTDGPFPGLRGAELLPPRGPLTAFGWEQDPAGLLELLLRLDRDHPGVPLLITENGAAFDDVVDPNGRVQDSDRVTYLSEHLRAVYRAIGAGVDLRGYVGWSLLDNFEWAEGYSKRFGLVHVDFRTQRRTVKESGHWYARVMRRNGLSILD